LNFSGFDSNDLAIVLLKYSKKESSLPYYILRWYQGLPLRIVPVRIPCCHYPYVELAYDLEITLPALSQTYRIRDLTMEGEYQRLGALAQVKENCSNKVTYYLDNVLVSTKRVAQPGIFPGPAPLTIRK
jgi:hypothetical protein